ncbi:MAG: 50S ribosomal protein L25 [Chloroflexota bacterium]
MERMKIEARPRRVVGKQVNALRRQGRIPAVLYGRGISPQALELEARQASRVLFRVSGSTLVELMVNGDSHTVLVREIQRDPILTDIRHVDFLKVAMDVAIRTSVPLDIVGEAPAVKTYGGVLVTGLDEIEVEALPGDLPDRVTVDLESLAHVGESITVGDLFVGKNVKVLTPPDEVVVRVTAQAVEEVEVVAPAAEVAEPEVIERAKKEEEVEEEEEAE